MPPSNPFNPVSPQAQSISEIFILTLVIAGAVLLLVLGLVLFAAIRFRRRSETGDPEQVFGDRRLETAWTVAPGLLLLGLFILTLIVMHNADPSAASGGQPDLVIIAHQWWWEVRYPKSGVVTANEIHIPVGRKLLTRIESADVIHDFWVPQLGRKMDAVPGHPNFMWIEAVQQGTLLGTCAEYCGAQHAWMRIRVIVQSQTDFAAWEQAQIVVPETPTSGKAGEGAKAFLEGPCVACHTIAGTIAQADIGPNLTHVSTRKTLGAGVLENNPANLAAWIGDPQAFKPGNLMPVLHLPENQIEAIVAYLEALQ